MVQTARGKASQDKAVAGIEAKRYKAIGVVAEARTARAGDVGEQEGGGRILDFLDKYAKSTVPSTLPLHLAYAALYRALNLGHAVTDQVIQADNGQLL